MRCLLFFLILIFNTPSVAIESTDRNIIADKVLPVALQWLAVVDAQLYEQSWHQTSAYFRSQVNLLDWRDSLIAVRKPLGAVGSRHINSVKTFNRIEGGPDGHYLVFIIDTDFDNQPALQEIITLVRIDNQYQVIGYFIE
ncbi:DUF4019 domain-containing protein [Shewanella aestuarii]|uniref:DUF4019 domain-containing protein n=1 Tax=Shewanella aestuarii TaxID=1028752 RepID=A0A6G9QJ73_9GAMM|nr:DUF4019 domain-containing protein [Shewanella aestuarii]QIR14522.1 DUF4019 domain-containing protein [Shewanella aestuarii]